MHTHKLAERILTQMLFSEELFQEAPVFEAYYAEGAYFRLQQAYLAYISREYVVEERKIGKNVIDVICQEYEKGEPTIDICKIAVLKYYSTREYGYADKEDSEEVSSGTLRQADLFPVLPFL